MGSGAYANGFPLNNTETSVSTNAAYMVIASVAIRLPSSFTFTTSLQTKPPSW